MSLVPELMSAQVHNMRIIPIAIITNKNEIADTSMSDSLSLALAGIRDFLKLIIAYLPEFKGEVKLE